MSDVQAPPTLPETVSKTTVLVCLGLCIFSGMIGFAFGADAGYAKGVQDCTTHSIEPVNIQAP